VKILPAPDDSENSFDGTPLLRGQSLRIEVFAEQPEAEFGEANRSAGKRLPQQQAPGTQTLFAPHASSSLLFKIKKSDPAS
jgi:hypothetical protein